MATSRPIKAGDRLTHLRGFAGSWVTARGDETPDDWVLQSDFGLMSLYGEDYYRAVSERVFGVPYTSRNPNPDPRCVAAVADGTAPGLYVQPGDELLTQEALEYTLHERAAIALLDRRIRVSSPPSPPPAPLPPPPRIPAAAAARSRLVDATPPTRFDLLEVDGAAPPQTDPKATTDLAALQQELRAEREAKRALAAAQRPPERFALLECDLPAVPVVAPAIFKNDH